MAAIFKMAAKLLNSVLITTKIGFSIINAITMHRLLMESWCQIYLIYVFMMLA